MKLSYHRGGVHPVILSRVSLCANVLEVEFRQSDLSTHHMADLIFMSHSNLYDVKYQDAVMNHG